MATERSEADVRLARLIDEFAERCRRGERPSLEEYTDRYPELADDIRDLFPALAEIEEVKGEQRAADGPAPPPLRQLGDYRLLREVGRGGMGVVYEAEQISLGRHVALKVLPAQFRLDAKQRRRFEREAKAAARLHHTNIVPVFGVGEKDDVSYYVMQFIQGLGLDAVIDELRRLRGGPGAGDLPPTNVTASAVALSLLSGQFQPQAGAAALPSTDPAATPSTERPPAPSPSSSSVHLPGLGGEGRRPRKATYWQSVASIGVQVAEALEYAHKQGVLHRDVKPSNLLLDTGGTVWVTDFGLAKADDRQDLTRTGDLLGTLRYMPPEAFDGRADARADVYALGLTLYELLAFRPAFDEKERNRLIKQVTSEEPARLDRLNRDVPRDLVTVVHKAIDRDPARRYPTAGDFAADLQRFLDDEPIKARRASARERCWRWCRRNRAIATSLAMIAALLIAGLVGLGVATVQFREQALAQQQLAGEKEVERNKAVQARDEADAARQKLGINLIDMHTSHGLVAAERNDAAQALLWFANAARLARNDPEREQANRVRVRTWSREAFLPLRALTHDGQSLRLLAFCPGGDYLLTLTASGRCYVWDWRSERCLPWADGQRAVLSAGWSPDGRWLVLGLSSGKVEIHSVPSGDLVEHFDHPGPVASLAFSRDGRRLALASDVVRVWDCREKRFSAGEWKHPQPVHSLIFNPRGDRLATACRDKQVRVFAVAGGLPATAPLFPPVPHKPGEGSSTPTVSPPAFIDGGRGLVTIAGPAELTWWDAETGKPAGRGKFATQVGAGIPGVVASPDGASFVFGSWMTAKGGVNGSQVWQVARADAPATFLPHANGVTAYAYSPDGGTLLTVSWDRMARLWSLPEGKMLGYPVPHQSMVDNGTFSPDGRLLATGQRNGLVTIWRRPAEHPGVRAMPFAHEIVGLKPSRDGRHVIAGKFLNPFQTSGMGCRNLRVHEMASGAPVGAALEFQGECVDAALSSDGRSAAVVVRTGTGGQLHVRDVQTGKAAFPPLPLPDAPLSVAFSFDDSRLAVLCRGGQVVVVDPHQGRSLHEFGLEGWVKRQVFHNFFGLQFTADGSIVVLHTDYSLHVRDPMTGRLRYAPIRLDHQQGWCAGFQVSGDGRLLATAVGAAKNNPVRVWDLESGKPLSPVLPHADVPYGLCFSPDGRRLFTGCRDGQARLWDWQAGRLACPPCKADDEVFSVAFTPDGRWGLTAARMGVAPGGKVRMWEFATGKPVSPVLYVGKESANGLAISPDGAGALTSVMGEGLWWIDLSPLSAPDDLDADDLCTLAELTSGQRIHEGDLAGLSSDEWLDRWRAFRERHPEYGSAEAQ
jgi:WD40 repeat protein/serine/threonine protein kinase